MKDNSFKDFVVDQLSDVQGVLCRAMFGGFGLYRDGHIFGVIADGRLWFKTDPQSAERYLAEGMTTWKYSPGYYEVPPGVLDDPIELADWARTAADVGARTPPKKVRAKKKTVASD